MLTADSSLWSTSNAVLLGAAVLAAGVAARHVRSYLRARADHQLAMARAAQQAELRYRAMVEHSWDTLVMLDAQGLILFASDPIQRLFGVPPELAVGVAVADRLDPPYRQSFLLEFSRCIASPGAKVTDEFMATRRDGQRVWVEVVAVNRLDDPELRAVLVHMRDCTDRKAQEALIARLERTRRLAAAINRALVLRPEPHKLLEQACAAAIVHGELPLAFAYVFDKGDLLDGWLVQRSADEKFDVAVELLSTALDGPQQEALLGQLRGGQSLVINDMRTGEINDLAHSGSDATSDNLRRVAALGLRSAGCWPLMADGHLLGALALATGDEGYFNEQECNLLTELASDIAFGIDSHYREQDREAIHRKADRDHARLVALAELNNLPDSTDNSAYMRWVVDHAAVLSASDTAFLHVLTPDGRASQQGMWNARTLELCSDTSIDHCPLDQAGLWADAIRTRAPVICQDYQSIAKPGALPEGHFALTRFVCVPVVEGEAVRLVLGVGNKLTDYDESDVRNTALLAEGLWAILRRRRDQQALRDGEALYREMFAGSPLPMFNFDAKTLAVLQMNDSARARFGLAAHQLFDLSVLDLVVPEERARLQTYLHTHRDEDHRESEWRLVGANGQPWIGKVISHELEASGGTRQAMAIDVTATRQSEEQTAKHVRELEITNRSAIQVISTIGELRDPYTQGHEQRVGGLAAAIGRELGLSTADIEGLQIAGWLHDVGKIALPSEILAKPGRLTKLEFDLIKQHPQQGHAILKDLKSPWPVAMVALQHHERIDGSGYPAGLRGEEICRAARIMAVADVVEAMASHRPYRAALGLEAGLAEIERGRGVHYDAAAVDACLALMRQGRFDFAVGFQ